VAVAVAPMLAINIIASRLGVCLGVMKLSTTSEPKTNQIPNKNGKTWQCLETSGGAARWFVPLLGWVTKGISLRTMQLLGRADG